MTSPLLLSAFSSSSPAAGWASEVKVMSSPADRYGFAVPVSAAVVVRRFTAVLSAGGTR
ncbi:hypothetical protein [Streptomyces flaveolus]|uniref:hypothetical protein n=1 Tax=Streptomyces flaveolus TaxID=67297 RepID=UPI0037F33F0D